MNESFANVKNLVLPRRKDPLLYEMLRTCRKTLQPWEIAFCFIKKRDTSYIRVSGQKFKEIKAGNVGSTVEWKANENAPDPKG